MEEIKDENIKFDFQPVYFVSFLNFEMDMLGDKLRTDAAICDLDTKQQISDKVRFIFIQLPKFVAESYEDCRNNFERWIFTIKKKMDFYN